MKKNKFMKLASGLLVLCLMTTCVIGATLAKYTTAKTVSDSARVANWGVRITLAADSAFNPQYQNDASTVTVKSTTEKVVAPGTRGTAAEFSIAGTPEVSATVTFKMTATNGTDPVKDIMLAEGTYTNYDGSTVNVGEGGYYPVVFTLKKSGDPNPVASGTLAQVAEKVNLLSTTINPGEDLAAIGSYTLTWEWPFSVDADKDVADTILGDVMAGKTDIQKGSNPISASDYSTSVEFKISITVTQID